MTWSFLLGSYFLHTGDCNGQIVQLLLIRPTRLAGRGPLLVI